NKTKKEISTPILYGGSVSKENIKDFLMQDCIDGALIGSASLNSEQFLSIIQTIDTL
ncbi:MAG: triose-phosphate isomerase, partial [SAR202 cluster bacterium]|nr:triose-phosphate isomerase [SAR202 cluster bacterium]